MAEPRSGVRVPAVPPGDPCPAGLRLGAAARLAPSRRAARWRKTVPPAPRGQLPDSAVAESLRLRVSRLRAIASLPDSVQEQAIDQALDELGGVLENLTQELSNLDVQIEDQAISLRDRAGGGRVRINIPPDLGTRISQGISSITASILDELPDTLVIRGGTARQQWRLTTPSVRDAAARIFAPAPRPLPRRGAWWAAMWCGCSATST